MKIEQIDLYHVRLPLIYPWRTAYGEDSDVHSILVRMRSGSHEAWGESCPLYAPTYSPEATGAAFYLLREFFAPMIVGENIESAQELNERLSCFKGNPFAKAALEVTWWMLEAAIRGEPLHQLLGGQTRNVQAGNDFGVQDSLEMLLAKIEDGIARGFPRTKLKVRPGWDLEMLGVVRSHFPRHTFHIDCNCGYTLDDLPFFREVDKLGLAMIEQPLAYDDLHDHAELQRQIQTPICLDESVKSRRHFELALRLGSCRYLNIKPGRVGGLQVAKELHDLARDAGIPCWVGGMLESCIGAAICIELATLDNFTYPADLFPSSNFYREDLTDPVTQLNADCTFTPSSVPGIPYVPIQERIEERCVAKATILPPAPSLKGGGL
jgi:O-succinylbenzoate synthase